MKKGFFLIFSAALLLLCACHSVRKPEDEAIVKGVSHTALSRPEGPWEIRVIRIARDAKVSIEMVMSHDTLSGRERVSDAAARLEKQNKHVIAGVNGDFYFIGNQEKEGLPLGPSVSFGRLFTSGRSHGAFYIDSTGMPHIDSLTFHGTIENDGKILSFDTFNWEGSNSKDKKYVPPDQKKGSGILVFSSLWSWKIPFRGVCVRMDAASIEPGASYEGEVTGLFTAGETVRQEPGSMVIVGLGDQEPVVNGLKGKVRLSFGFKETDRKLKTAIGSWQVLLKDGKSVVKPGGPRHPRTMIGFNGKDILLVTVDGRQKGWSMGMTSHEQAELLRELGCTEGCNIDGGGSTTAWFLGKCMNRPSDKAGMRPNANCILVIE